MENGETNELTEYSIDAAVVFGVVGDLRVFSKHDFTASGNHTKLGDIDFNYCSLRQHAQLGIHRGLWVLLDTQYLQLESGF